MTTPPPPPGKPGGKPGALGALQKKPTAALAIGGVAVVVVLALVKRSSGAGAAGTTTTTGTGAGTPTYDSTANDVYNSIETQLEAFQQQLTDLQNGLPNGAGSTTSGGASVPGGGTIISPPPALALTPGAPLGMFQGASPTPGGAGSHLAVQPIRRIPVR